MVPDRVHPDVLRDPHDRAVHPQPRRQRHAAQVVAAAQHLGRWRLAHPPRGHRCDPGHGLRRYDGDTGGRRGSTRIHGRSNLLRYRRRAGARRVRADPAPAGRVLVRGRPDIGGRGVRRDRGGRAADPRIQPAVVLRHRHLARRPHRGGAGHGDRAGGADAAACGGRAAQGQGVDRAWSGCSSRRCWSSARSGCPGRTRRGRAGATPTSRARCTGRCVRERVLRRPVVQAKLWLQHVIAGEPHFPDDSEVDRAARPGDPRGPRAGGTALRSPGTVAVQEPA